MDDFSNDIRTAYKHLPEVFKKFNESNGKDIYNEILIGPNHNEEYVKSSNKQLDTKSILILHLAGDTKELVSYLEDNKSFLFK